jgi:predicted metal-binding membrane protein
VEARALSARLELRAALALAAVAGAAWLALLAGPEMPMEPVGYLTAWTVMMAAMMLPSAAPLVLLYRGSRALLSVGYLVVWGAVGLVPYAAMTAGLEPPAALVLAAAGGYQLTPLKSACLRRCRSPVDFLMRRWRAGALRLGVEHGVYCLGCCAGLMLVLVAAAAMSVAWAAVIALAVAVEKLAPRGEAWARATGIGLLVLAIAKGVA